MFLRCTSVSAKRNLMLKNLPTLLNFKGYLKNKYNLHIIKVI